MRNKTQHAESSNSEQLMLERTLADALDQGFGQVVGEMTPHQYVALRTMSPFEIGYRFKQLLRDVMYERRRGRAMKRQRNRVARAPSR